LQSNNLIKEQYLSGQNFVKLSDVAYAANISTGLTNSIPKENITLISQNELITTYKLNNLHLKNGDVIFCSSGYLELLFYYLNKVKKIKNLTLISGQSDISIDHKLFLKKPECITKWYSVNVDHSDSVLKPIPLGLANDYSPKNIRINDFLSFKEGNTQKENKLYINLQKSTNYKEREKLENIFHKKEWVEFKEPILSIEEYLNDLKKYKFVLCPWGNGYDTHRLWETLYSGSIPVTKKHITYESFKHLPIIFIEDYADITYELLNSEVQNFKNINYEILNIDYWKKEIFEINLNEERTEEIILENKIFEIYYWKKLYIKSFIKNKYKVFQYYLKKLTKTSL